MDVLKTFGVAGLAVLVAFFLVRDVLAPLVKSVTHKSKQPSEPNRVQVLELNLTKLTTRVEDFGKILCEQNESVDKLGQAVDNKMDIMLQELKEIRDEFADAYREMAQRISKAETHIEHLLKAKTGRA